MSTVYVHADDFGYTLNTSKDIIECIKNNNLDSFSIICNTTGFDDSIKLLYDTIPTLVKLPKIAVHINIVEGYSLSNSSFLSNNGIINTSWLKLLFSYFSTNKRNVEDQLEKEIVLQIEKVKNVYEKCLEIAKNNNVQYEQHGLRIDSHVHTHAIPVVFNALTRAINTNEYNVENIRNPKEPILPFILSVKNIFSYKPTNVIKNIVLNIFSHRIDKYCDENQMTKTFMWGLIMSGKMDYERINNIYSNMYKKAKDNNRNLEILFHPGKAMKNEYSNELNKENMDSFNTTINRTIEKNTVDRIKNIIK